MKWYYLMVLVKGSFIMAMMLESEIKTVSVRMPANLYSRVRDLAQMEKISINAFIGNALAQQVEEAMDQQMYDAATLISEDSADASVEYAFAAQAEVALSNE